MLINGIKGQRDHAIASAKSNFEFFIEKHSFSKDYLQAAPLNMYEVDSNGKTLWANQATLDTLGLTLDKYINKTYIDFSKMFNIPYEVCQEFMDDDNRVVQTGKPIINKEEPCNVLPDGRVKYFLTSRWPIFCDRSQKVIAVFGASHDITEIRLREIESISDCKMLSSYTTRVGHDIANGIDDIAKALSSLHDFYPQSIESRLYIEKIVAQILSNHDKCREMLGFIKDRRDHNKQRHIMPCKLLDVLMQRFESFAEPLRKNTIKKTIDPMSMDIEIKSDVPLITSVLTNLVSNSLASMMNGSVCLNVSSVLNDGAESKDDVTWFLEVSDKGSGLDDRRLRFLESDDDCYEMECDGIGMSVIKRAVYQNLNGKILCKKNNPRGTSISVVFKNEINYEDEGAE